MSMPEGRGQPAGVVVGSMVAVAFGTIFVLVNSAGLSAPWPLAIRFVGVLVAALLIVGVVLVARTASPAMQAPASDYLDRRYWLVVALEGAALFAGLAVINDVLHRTAVSVAWVALVVGVHFIGLAAIWGMPLYNWLGAAMIVLSVAGFLIFTLGGPAAMVGLVAGVGSGLALYVAVGAALLAALRGRASVAT